MELRLLPYLHGHIIVSGEEIKDEDIIKWEHDGKKVIFQSHEFVPSIRLFERLEWMLSIEERAKEALRMEEIEEHEYSGYIFGAGMQKALTPYSYDNMIEFAEWIRIMDFQTTSKNNWIGLDMRYYSTSDLFIMWKSQRKQWSVEMEMEDCRCKNSDDIQKCNGGCNSYKLNPNNKAIIKTIKRI